MNQVQKEYQCSDDNMAAYLSKVQKFEQKFKGLEVTYIRRGKNSTFDELTRLASSRSSTPLGVFIEKLLKLFVSIVSSTNAAQLDQQSSRVNKAEPTDTEVALLECELTWMTPF